MRLSKHHDLSAFVSKDETRCSLNGVHFDPARNRVCATNGHFLAMVNVAARPEGEGDLKTQAIIEAKALSAALKALPRKGEPEQTSVAVLPEEEGRVRLQNCTTAHLAATIEGRFPEADLVVPPASELVIGLSATYLRTIADYVVKHGVGPAPGLRLYFPTGPLSPVRFEAIVGEDARDNAVIVLMPMRL